MSTRKKPTIKYEKNLVTNKTTIATPRKVIKDRMDQTLLLQVEKL